MSDNSAAFALANEEWPGRFGVYYETDRPTKNKLEQRWIDDMQSKVGDASTADLLKQRFEALK